MVTLQWNLRRAFHKFFLRYLEVGLIIPLLIKFILRSVTRINQIVA